MDLPPVPRPLLVHSDRTFPVGKFALRAARSSIFWLVLATMVLPAAVASVGPANGVVLPPAFGHAAALPLTGRPGGPIASPDATLRAAPSGTYPLDPALPHVRPGSSVPQVPSPPAAPSAPSPMFAIVTGTFTGYVNGTNGTGALGTGLSGVTVEAYSVGGALCPATTCAPVTTGSSGYFSATCPVGAAYLRATVDWWLSNITYATCVQGVTTYVGTIYLVHDAIATGTIRGDDPAHETIGAVSVFAQSRDLQVSANPGMTTGSGGTFIVAVPPSPSVITFTPSGPAYVSNETWVSGAAWKNLSLGTVYLERNTVVRVEIYDAVNGQAVTSGAALVVCNSLSGLCGQQGTFTYSSILSALGPPGPDYVQVIAPGPPPYVVDDHPIGFVPRESPGHVFDAGKVNLLPFGEVAVNISMGVSAGVASVWQSLQWTSYENPYPHHVANGLAVIQMASLDGYAIPGTKMNSYFGINGTVSTSTVTVGCTLAGVDGGAIVGFFAPPLRTEISIAPDSAGNCGGPPTWPIPGNDPPAWGNSTVVNVTPRMLTGSPQYGIPLNFTAGTYIAGNVSLPGSPSGLDFVSVGATSQEYPSLAVHNYVYAGPTNAVTSPWECGTLPGIPAPSGTYVHTFCTAVPPGPVELTVTGPTNTLQNFTWASTAATCCNLSQLPARLSQVNVEHWSTINLTTIPWLWGRVYASNTTVAIPFSAFKVCSAGSASYLACQTGVVEPNGTFTSLTPPGWVGITISAAGYSPNTTWAYVSGTNTSVGTITLEPLATIYGKVVDGSTGRGVTEAVVQYCAIVSSNSCQSLGAGQTTTDGGYNGTVTGGWLPWATYRIQATAAGYTSNWVWVNGTAAAYSPAPTIYVLPLGTNTSNGSAPLTVAGSPSPRATSYIPPNAWVDGTILDNATGWGVQPSSLSATSPDGSVTIGFANGTNTGGEFNDSVPWGVYALTATLAGYYPLVVKFNASGRAVVHLGRMRMDPYPWVSGRARMSPWESVSVALSSTRVVNVSFTPAAVAEGCDAARATCGPTGALDSLGYFNVSAPSGTGDIVSISGTYSGGGASVAAGFASNYTRFNLTGNSTDLTVPVDLPMDSIVEGSVWDASTMNASGAPQLPARFVTLSFYVTGNQSGAVSTNANGGGSYAVVLPSNLKAPSAVYFTAQMPGYYYPRSYTYNEPVAPGTVVDFPQLNLSRWGWVETQTFDRSAEIPVPFLPVSATFDDIRNATTWSSSGESNLDGWANLSAPVGKTVVVQGGPGNDYNSSSVKVEVNESATSYANVSNSSGSWTGDLSIPAWGWVRSASVNGSSVPNLATVVDKVGHRPLPSALVGVCSTDNRCGQKPDTNWMGQFVLDAPIGPKDAFSVSRPGYLANNSPLDVHGGETIIKPGWDGASGGVNLTGDGVVAGIVLSYPGGQPVPDATVSACPHNGANFPVCSSTTSNASGIFWVVAPPQFDDILVSASGFVSNTSAAYPCSDCWDWMGAVTVDEYAYVSGIVRGLPSGLPIVGATVAACSTLGNPVGVCAFNATTDLNGHFLLPVPASTYILQTNDTFYNSSYLPLALSPGQRVNVGTIFLSQFGWLAGQVYSSATFAPVPGASVYACARWAGGICTPTTTTNSAGRFTVSGAPGPYLVSVVAPGYTDRYVDATIQSGVTTTIPVVFLDPLGTGLAYPVTGRVVNASSPSQVIPGAIVAALVNGTPAVSTDTDGSGTFHLSVLWGTYNLSVVAPGYHPLVEPLVVTGPMSGLVLQLSVMTYNVTGEVTDALTHQPLSGVGISYAGTSLSVTGADGFYQVALPNGTADLMASYGGGGPVAYPSVAFTVAVNGVGQRHDVAMYPPTTMIYGLVVDQETGLAVPGASVTISGRATDGVPVNQTVTTDSGGSFSVLLPQGTYASSAAITGYASGASVNFDASGNSYPLTLEVAPVGQTGGSAGPTGTSGLVALLATVVAVLGVLTLVVFLLTRRPPKGSAAAGRSGRVAKAGGRKG